MAASVSTPTTLTKDIAPHLGHVAISAILATAPENMTRAQVQTLVDMISRIPAGTPTQTVITMLAGYI